MLASLVLPTHSHLGLESGHKALEQKMIKHLTGNHYVHVKEGKPRLNRSKSRYYCTELFHKTLQKQEGQAKTFPLFLQNYTNTLPVSQTKTKSKTRFDYPVPSGAEIGNDIPSSSL